MVKPTAALLLTNLLLTKINQDFRTTAYEKDY